jgi:hypothetical protein
MFHTCHLPPVVMDELSPLVCLIPLFLASQGHGPGNLFCFCIKFSPLYWFIHIKSKIPGLAPYWQRKPLDLKIFPFPAKFPARVLYLFYSFLPTLF